MALTAQQTKELQKRGARVTPSVEKKKQKPPPHVDSVVELLKKNNAAAVNAAQVAQAASVEAAKCVSQTAVIVAKGEDRLGKALGSLEKAISENPKREGAVRIRVNRDADGLIESMDVVPLIKKTHGTVSL